MSVLIAACFGLILGSFFNVLIWRIPRKESIVFPSSHCTNCGRKVKSWENIPVLSYIFLKGKCAGCSSRISITYPLVELTTGGVAVFLWLYIIPHHLLPWHEMIPLIVQCTFLLLIIPMAIIDIRHYIIPDSFSLSLLAVSLGISFLPGCVTPLQSLLGILAGGGALFLIGLLGTLVFKKEAMGFGDVKLMAAAGALWGPAIALMGIIFGALLGSLVGIPLILLKNLKADQQIPFGPFLGLGIWIAVTCGFTIVFGYLNFVDRLFGLN